MEWFWIKAYHHDAFASENRPFVIISGIPWSFASFRWFTKYPCLDAYPPSLFVPLCQIYLNINLWSAIKAKLALTNICTTRPKPSNGRDRGASSMAKTKLIQNGLTTFSKDFCNCISVFLQLFFCILLIQGSNCPPLVQKVSPTQGPNGPFKYLDFRYTTTYNKNERRSTQFFISVQWSILQNLYTKGLNPQRCWKNWK